MTARRFAQIGVAWAIALVATLVAAAPCLAIAPYVRYTVDAPGNCAPTGWYNVPVTFHFSDIAWDDPIPGGIYPIQSVAYSRDGGAPVSVVPTASLALQDDGDYMVTCAAPQGFSAFPIMFGIDRTPPTSALSITTDAAGQHASVAVFDAGSGPGFVRFSLDGAAETSCAVSPQSGCVAIPAGPGAHTLRWIAVDVAGNAESAWHQAGLMLSGPLRLGKPAARVRCGRVQVSGRLAERQGSAVTLFVTITQRHGSTWRRWGRTRVVVARGTASWHTGKLRLRRGHYRVCVTGPGRATSPTLAFRR